MSGTLTAVSETSQLPYGGGGDAQGESLALSARFRRHADALVRSERSPLYVRLMRGAADDIDAGGVVARLFAGISTPPGSVPQLRLMGALHYLVLAGHAPALAAFYPSAGGDRPVDGVWPVAEAVMEEQFEHVRARLHRTVQTNEPGRSAVLFAGLLWLTDRHHRPIRLLEIGASAGLNLLADRYSYTVDGRELGDADSPLRFVDPWTGPPPIDLHGAASDLRIVARAGCDLSPLDPSRAEDRLTLLSYIWPDELHRIARMRAALSVAERDPAAVTPARASDWLPRAFAGVRGGELTVVWHSVMRQYVEPDEWAAIERALSRHPGAVRLSMEPVRDRSAPMQLTVHDPVDAPGTALAACDDHGMPIRWET
jgi:hypothetical protein